MLNTEATPLSTDTMQTRSPTWWKDDNQSGWDRAKEAFRRDWEQTKSDFTGARRGTDLNQDIDDTVGQTLGKKAIPAEGVPNPMDADELKDYVRTAEKQMDRTTKRLAKDAEKSIEKAKDEDQVSSRRLDRWEDAETPMRYGYGAAGHYGTNWDDKTERTLRGEWTELYPQRSWEDVRDTVRTGWRHGQSDPGAR